MIVKKFMWAALAALTLQTGRVAAQNLFAAVDFETLFDNREYSGTHFADASETFFSARLTPEVGLDWDRHNALVVGVELLQDFGDGADFLTEVKPQIYYRFTHERGAAAAGIFPRRLLRGDYNEAFFDRSYLFYNNRIQGLMGRYEGRRGFAEFALDWVGKQSPERREQFRILSAGRYDAPNGRFYGGYALMVQHFAKTTEPAEDEGVVDNILVNPFVGVRFEAFFRFDIRAGYLQGLARDRIAAEGWKSPCGALVDIALRRRGWLIRNSLYAGGDLMPLAGRYGSRLYAGSPFFSAPDHVFNRTELGYERRFFRQTLGVRGRLLLDYDGGGLGTAQVVEVNVRLEKMFGKSAR